jgi:hypothetical protein
MEQEVHFVVSYNLKSNNFDPCHYNKNMSISPLFIMIKGVIKSF